MNVGKRRKREYGKHVVVEVGKNYDFIYSAIHKSLWDLRTRLRNNQDRHGRKEHINR